MKFTISTLVAFSCLTTQATYATYLSRPLTLNIMTDWRKGAVTVYQDKPVDLAKIPDKDMVSLQGGSYYFVAGLPYGFTNEGHPDRFDIIDDGQAPGYYYKCEVLVLEDLKIDMLAIVLSGPLAHFKPQVVDYDSSGIQDFEGKIEVHCECLKNGG